MTPGSRSMHGFATIDINASPEAVSSLISDVTQIGRFSPETFEAQVGLTALSVLQWVRSSAGT